MDASKIESMHCTPIGYFHSWQKERYMAAKQGELAGNSKGKIILLHHQNFEQALEDLRGMERIWVIYWFHRNSNWKPKVQTPRQGPKRGVFATRSPHRPNPIGLSCVNLLEVSGRELIVDKCDLLDETPILDIKPYLPYADAFPNSKTGWIHQEEKPQYSITWSEISTTQADFIEKETGLALRDTVNRRLLGNPFPFPGHRIKETSPSQYVMALKTWRIHYSIAKSEVKIEEIASGYDQETLEGRKTSLWPDISVHQNFTKIF